MPRLSLVGLLALATLAPLGAQAARGASLLGRFDPGNLYNDVWGYVAPDGRELALLAADNGTYVVDCTVATAPRELLFVAGPSACCRDIRTYRSFAYVVNDGGGGGLQIIDLSDPATAGPGPVVDRGVRVGAQRLHRPGYRRPVRLWHRSHAGRGPSRRSAPSPTPGLSRRRVRP
ncbi:MAG: hypothetical protein AAF628_32045 [Planctomycetota bacterium]